MLIDAPERELATPDAVGSFEIREALDALPPGMRDALLVHCLLGFTEQETAQVLGVPVGTVKSRVSRARLLFGKLLFEGRTSHEQKGEQDAPSDLDDMRAAQLLSRLADAADALEPDELGRMSALAVASARSPGAGSHRPPGDGDGQPP